jgi:nucleotidyltransferase/DNA polymerase involved in DNA repair
MLNSIIAHIDMDCFFCSCELKRDKSLKEKPIIVGGVGFRGVVSAANYEARKFGVYSATPIKIARKLCPEGVFLSPDKNYYKSESDKIMNLLYQFTNTIKQVSVDEAYLDLTIYSKKFNNLFDMAKSIQEKIKKETDLSCSIGVSNSLIVAKIASDFKKPSGITIVLNPKEFLAPLDIKKIPGIGKVLVKKYYEHGIKTIKDLSKKDKFYILDNFGMQGIYFQNIANGLDRTKITQNESIKSVSREKTFSNDTNDILILKNEIRKLCEMIYYDLKNYEFKTVSIKIRYQDFKTITRDITLNTHTNSFDEILSNTLNLFDLYYDTKKNIRLLGIKLSHLTCGKDFQITLLNYL